VSHWSLVSRERRFSDAGFEDGGKGSRVKECGQPAEAGKDEVKDSSLELPEGIPPCGPILNFWPPEL
jgi:hypothetical protein